MCVPPPLLHRPGQAGGAPGPLPVRPRRPFVCGSPGSAAGSREGGELHAALALFPIIFFFSPPQNPFFKYPLPPAAAVPSLPVWGINRTEPRCCFSVPSGRLSCHPSPRGGHTHPPVSRSSRHGPSSPRGPDPHPQERALSGRGLPLFFSCLGCKYCRGAGLTQTSYRIP